jgi:iron complex outermembrane receptor protein
MFMTRVILFCAAFCLWCASAFPQVTDSLTYPEVRVDAYRIANAIGTKQTTTDSALLQLSTHQDVAAVLQLQGNVQVRAYGPGGIATFSMRGTTAGHTQVVWMGIPINDPMLGVSDLGAMPLNGLGGIRLLSGAAAMPHHSGGIGGTIELIEHTPRLANGITATASGEWGSFHTYAAGAKVQLRKNKWWANTSFNYRQAKNDFDYADLGKLNHPTRTMEHADMQLWGISQAIGYALNKANSLALHFRFSETDRLLPATMLMASTKETLWDRDIWLALRYKRVGTKSLLEATTAYIHGQQEYYGNDDYRYPYLYQASKTIVRYRYQLARKLELKSGIDHSSERAISDTAYGHETVWRHWQALFASLSYAPTSWLSAQAMVREDLINAKFSPVQALAGVEVGALKWWRISANVSRNFRAPSLNDLYWTPGGNRDLKNETGFSFETGMRFYKRWNKFNFDVNATYFRTEVDNWILWTPGAGSVWSPQNMRKVLAQGVELQLQLGATIRKVQVALYTEYDFTQSTVTQSMTMSDEAVGKQLIYTPVHSAKGHVSVQWKGLVGMYGLQYTGQRYTSSDNLSSLPAFHVSWISASYRLPIQKHALQLGGAIDNLFNQQYQAIAWRPMPGRAFRVTLSYTFSS